MSHRNVLLIEYGVPVWRLDGMSFVECNGFQMIDIKNINGDAILFVTEIIRWSTDSNLKDKKEKKSVLTFGVLQDAL